MKFKIFREQFDTTFEVIERAGRELPKGVIMQMRGKFGHAGRITENGRLYSRKLMEREIKKLAPRIAQKAIIGETDHPGPTQGGPSVRQSAFIITGLGMNEDGEIYGQADVVDTAAGRDFSALVRAGAQVGVSSRGRGTSKPSRMTSQHPDFSLNQDWEDKQYEEINDDFSLRSFDAVIGQAVIDAYIGDYNEQIEEEGMITFDDLKKLLAEKGNEDFRKQVTSFVLESEDGKKVISEKIKEAVAEERKKFEEEIKELVVEYLESDEFAEQFEVEGLEGKDDKGDDKEEAVGACSNCGFQLKKGMSFCPQCGVKAQVAKKEQTQDDKDKQIVDLTKRLEALEASSKEKDDKISAMEKKEKDRKEDEEIELAVSECLKAQPSILAEQVREDLNERDDITVENVKELVKAKIKRLKAFNEATGGSLTDATGKGKSLPNDKDDLTEGKGNSTDKKPVTPDLRILDSLD